MKTFQQDGHAVLDVTDSGIGIEGDTSAFFEFGKSLKGSSGFGLTFCKEFVEANKGHIELTSGGPGKGATVKVVFEACTEENSNEN